MIPRHALLVCAVALALSGCSSEPVQQTQPSSTASALPTYGSAQEPDVPDGFTTYDGDDFSFAYPADWDLTERAGQSGPVVVAQGPLTGAGLPLQFVVATQPDYAGDLDLVVNGSDFVRTLPEQKVVRDVRVSYSGDVPAQITERTFTAPTPDGSARARILELRLVTQDRLLVTTAARTSDGDFAGSPLPEVFDSFRLAGQ